MSMLARHRINLHRVNTILFTLIVLINTYIIVAPLLPQLTYWWGTSHTQRETQLQRLINKPIQTDTKSSTSQIAQSNTNQIIAPKMLLDQQILEGPESNWFNILYKGIWRWPASSTPDKGGNTVFLSHRFSYTGPRGAFYYLNRLKIGDEVGVLWGGKTYTYIVTSSQVDAPTDTAIEDNTADAQITLFTCTPLWHPVNRLVIVAKLKGVS